LASHAIQEGLFIFSFASHWLHSSTRDKFCCETVLPVAPRQVLLRVVPKTSSVCLCRRLRLWMRHPWQREFCCGCLRGSGSVASGSETSSAASGSETSGSEPSSETSSAASEVLLRVVPARQILLRKCCQWLRDKFCGSPKTSSAAKSFAFLLIPGNFGCAALVAAPLTQGILLPLPSWDASAVDEVSLREMVDLLGRSPAKNCKNDLDDQT